MHQRPRLFIFLAILHFLEPLSKIIYFKINTRFPFSDILQNILAIEGIRSNFEFWLLFPLGGLCLLMIKKWSYPIFVTVQLYSIWSILSYQEYTWPYVAKSPHFLSIMLLSFNVLVITYFLMPGVRRPFYDRRMRWWETKPRYGAEIPCMAHIESTGRDGYHKGEAQILNISHSGAFISCNVKPEIGKTIKLDFRYQGMEFSLNAVVRNQRIMNGIEGHGIEFIYSDWMDNLNMRRFIRKLSTSFKNSYEEKAA